MVDVHAADRQRVETCCADRVRRPSGCRHVGRPRRRGAPRARRPGAAAAGLLEPAEERGQVHARRRARSTIAHADDRDGGGVCDRGRRHRHRHRAGRAAAHLRRLRAGRPTTSPGSSAGWGWGWRSARRWSSCTAATIAASERRPGPGRDVHRRRCRPLAPRPRDGGRGEPAGGRRAAAAGGRAILLVEDHADTRRADGAGCSSASATTSRTAEHRRRRRSRPPTASTFDLLISDIGLPDGSGLDLMRAAARSSARSRASP